jgi:hypothetical protein
LAALLLGIVLLCIASAAFSGEESHPLRQSCSAFSLMSSVLSSSKKVSTTLKLLALAFVVSSAEEKPNHCRVPCLLFVFVVFCAGEVTNHYAEVVGLFCDLFFSAVESISLLPD